MSKINAMLDVGKRSLMNSQTALQTVGHNIANKSTEGYSRQRVELATNEPINSGRFRVGMGAVTSNITRINNPYLEKQIGKEQAQFGYLEGKSQAMSRVEQVYNEQTNKGLNQFVSDFFNAFRELGNNPESLATRTNVRDTADFLTKDFKRVSTQLSEIQRDLDQQVTTQVGEINGMTQEIATLNEKIQTVEMTGAPANDERDRRDLLVKKLGEKINIRWAEGADSTVTISAGNSALLVSGYDARKLSVLSTPAHDGKGEGHVDIIYKSSESGSDIPVTRQMTGGSVGALLEVRDKIIGDLHNNLNDMAMSLAASVNETHSQGFDSYNKPGQAFFVVPANTTGQLASALSINSNIMDDPKRIAAAQQLSAPGDNRVANAIASLQYQKVMEGGTTTLDDFYNSVVGQVGVAARRADQSRDAQKDIVKQLNNVRESISGVSLDEEATRMIEFQKSFDASARLVKTADEMFDTVLNLKHL